ncbi:hypothetical protein ABT288_37795 [Streptomyces sp. NPDC001093]|uniref:hypothetical protein n=1 Tax=Streptomyces sp. NPDC001093 TaxID=3154376 RepID=UPI003319E3ED
MRLLVAVRRPRGIEGCATDEATEAVAFALGGALWTVPMRGGDPRGCRPHVPPPIRAPIPPAVVSPTSADAALPGGPRGH